MPLSPNQIAQLAYQAGFRGSALRMAVAVALAESGGNPNAYNPEVAAGTRPGHGSRGLWQIYGTAHPWIDSDQAFNPVTNAQAAYRVYREAGNRFTPWSTFNNGSAHKIAQSLNLNIPTGQINLQQTITGGGPAALAGAVGSTVSQPIGAAVQTAEAVAKPLVNISLLPEPVNQFLSSIAQDPQGVKKTIAVGLIGGLLFTIGLIMLIVAIGKAAPEPVKEVAGSAAKVALAAAL